MNPLGVNKIVLLGVLARAPQLHYDRQGNVRALLWLLTRVLPVGPQGEIAGTALEDTHLVYCEGNLVSRLPDLPAGAIVYVEGRNREQRMTDPSGISHRLAYVRAAIVRPVNTSATTEGANSVTLVGTVVRNPIAKATASDQPDSVKLRLTTTHHQHDEKAESAKYTREYHWVTFYGRLAEFVAARAREGSLVYVEGRNEPCRWQDAGGLHHRTIAVIGHYFQLLHAQSQQATPAPRLTPFELMHGYDVQLPFEEVSFSM